MSSAPELPAIFVLLMTF